MEIISDYRKIPGHKVKIQKPTAFLFTSNELEFEIKNTPPFIPRLPW